MVTVIPFPRSVVVATEIPKPAPAPISFDVSRSPTLYPSPPLTSVTAVTTPPATVILAVAPVPVTSELVPTSATLL